MTLASSVWTHGRWAPYCRGREAATPSPSGTVPQTGNRPRAGEVGGKSDAGGVFAGSAPGRVGRGVAPGLRDPVVPGGAEQPRVEVGRVPPDVGVAGDQLVNAQRPGVAGADCRVVVQPDLRSGDPACPGPKCRHMLLEPRRASALVHHQVSRVLRQVLQCVHCDVWVVRHPRSYQQGGATETPGVWAGLPPPALLPTRPGAALAPPLGCIGRPWSPTTTASARGAGGAGARAMPHPR